MMHDSRVKIVDFGFSKALENADDEVIEKHTSLGTVNTMAPEVLQGEKYGLKVISPSTQADIWSVGVIFYQMLFGDLPFISSDRAGLILLIKDKEKELFK
jgi:serine/threonine protein kinase